MAKIIHTLPNGQIEIRNLSPLYIERYGTEAAAIAQLVDGVQIHSTSPVIREGLPDDAINVREISDDDIPSSLIFRDAWTDSQPGTQIDIDMPTARQIHMDRIREKRDEALLIEDVKMMRALEDGDQLQIDAIKATKTVLRDIPQTFNLAVAVNSEGLDALWPSNLPRN